MRIRFLHFGLAALLLASISCDGFTGPHAGLPVDLAITALRDAPPPATVSVVGNRVVLAGAVGTPDPCYRFAAEATTVPGVLLVNLQARSSAEGCIQILGAFTYGIAVRNVPRGSWHVVLSYGISGRETSTLFSGTVIVE